MNLQEIALQILIRWINQDYKNIPNEFIVTLGNCIHIEFLYDGKWYATDIYSSQIIQPFEIKDS